MFARQAVRVRPLDKGHDRLEWLSLMKGVAWIGQIAIQLEMDRDFACKFPNLCRVYVMRQ